MLYKDKILLMFDKTPDISLSCTIITRKLIIEYVIPLPRRQCLYSNISSVLNKLVKQNILERISVFNSRNGDLYRLTAEYKILKNKYQIELLKEKIKQFEDKNILLNMK